MWVPYMYNLFWMYVSFFFFFLWKPLGNRDQINLSHSVPGEDLSKEWCLKVHLDNTGAESINVKTKRNRIGYHLFSVADSKWSIEA